MPSKEDWIWLAGFVDGEGCVSLYKAKHKRLKNHWVLKLRLNNCEMGLMRKLHEQFGGTLQLVPNSKKNSKWRDAFSIDWANCKCEPILKKLIPYLRTSKKDQAILALEFLASKDPHRGPKPLTEEEIGYRDGVVHQLRALKKTGTDDPKQTS